MSKLTIIFVAVTALIMTTDAATLLVPSQYPTIQAGINASSDGDTVLVSPGIYVENINFLGKSITVKSEQGAVSTTIDGNQVESVVTFVSGEGVNSILEGFTLTNGLGGGGFWDYTGGGITCKNSSSPTIKNNTITRNSASTAGGGIACLDYSDPIITNNTITGNTASQGGGIYGLHSFLTIRNNTITRNAASSYGGGIYGYYVGAIVTNNVISGNTAGNKGGGMAILEATHTPYPIWEIWNNVIADNSAGNGGGGISIQCSFPEGHHITNNTITGNSADLGGAIALYLSAYPVITNSILWDNSAPEIYVSEGGGEPTVNYSDIMGGWPGVGNIDEDPLFVDTTWCDYRLHWGSPCIDAGDPNPIYNDPDGTVADMGAFYYDQSMPLRILLTPFDTPIEIPAAGGSFDYYIQVTNIDQLSLNVDAWCDVTLPNGAVFGPTLGPVNIDVGSEVTIGRERTQNVPGGAPLGSYTYNAYATAGADTSTDVFIFVKLGPGGSDGSSGWTNNGESFDEWLALQSEIIIPEVYSLDQNYPNPFNAVTTIRFGLPEAAYVTLEIYDITGRFIESPLRGWRDAGYHKVTWTATNLASGVYIYSINAGDFTASGKAVLLK